MRIARFARAFLRALFFTSLLFYGTRYSSAETLPATAHDNDPLGNPGGQGQTTAGNSNNQKAPPITVYDALHPFFIGHNKGDQVAITNETPIFTFGGIKLEKKEINPLPQVGTFTGKLGEADQIVFDAFSKPGAEQQFEAQQKALSERAEQLEAQARDVSGNASNYAVAPPRTGDLLAQALIFAYRQNPAAFGGTARGDRLGNELLNGLNDRANDLSDAANQHPGVDPLNGPQLSSLAGQFADLAKNQLGSLFDSNNPSAYDLQTGRFGGSGDSLGLSGTSLLGDPTNLSPQALNQSIDGLNDLVRNPSFQERAGSIIGPEAKQLAQDAALAASVFQKDANRKVTGDGAKFVSDLVGVANGGLTRPILDAQNSAANAITIPGLKGILGKDGSKIDEASAEWIALARILSKQKHDQTTSPLWAKGSLELEKLIEDLRRYRALNLLGVIKVPQNPPMWQLYNNAIYKVAEQLRVVRKSTLPTESKIAQQQKLLFADLNKSSSALLMKVSLCKNSQCAEDSLTSFFDSPASREVWKKQDLPRYEVVRELTALVLLSRRLSLLDYPAAEKATKERFALAFVVIQTFKNLSDKKEKSLASSKDFAPETTTSEKAPTRRPASARRAGRDR